MLWACNPSSNAAKQTSLIRPTDGAAAALRFVIPANEARAGIVKKYVFHLFDPSSLAPSGTDARTQREPFRLVWLTSQVFAGESDIGPLEMRVIFVRTQENAPFHIVDRAGHPLGPTMAAFDQDALLEP